MTYSISETSDENQYCTVIFPLSELLSKKSIEIANAIATNLKGNNNI
jgi:hypothetical protein